jgi:hypothetical protein
MVLSISVWKPSQKWDFMIFEGLVFFYQFLSFFIFIFVLYMGVTENSLCHSSKESTKVDKTLDGELSPN